MKKALSLLLAFVMVLSLVPMTVFAAAAPTIYFETNFTEDMTVGDTFYVTANLKDNVVFSTMTLSLKWNESAISFTGFNVDRRGGLDTEVYTYSAPVFNQKLGIVTGSDYLGYDTNGRIFTANFKIIAEEGDLGIGLKTADATEFEMLDLEDKDLGTIIDTSAINGLAVGGVSSGPEMPEDAPFTAITTDAGPIVAIEEADWVNGVPHYIVTIPADAETAYVTAPDQVVMEDWTTGELQATAYASDLSFSGELLYISYNYEDTADGPKVEIPMEMTSTDWSGNEVKLSFFSNDEYNPATHAFGIEDANYACLGWISFVYDDGLEEYNISIDENMVGGTLYACDEDGNEITKAKAGETVFVEVEADEGYTTTGAYYINGQLANDFMFVMPEEDVVLTATFQKQHTHVYDKEVAADKYLKDAATCQSGAVYYKSCECGEFVTTADTFVSGESVTHHYVDGKCEWCQLAEVIGYRFATSADVSAENGGTAVVHVKITGHSDPSVTSYNAYDLTLTFDSDKLEYQGYDGAVKSDNGSVTVEGNTIRIVGCGADKDFGTEIAALTFKTKAEGNANVTIDKVQVSDKEESVKEDAPEATPKHDENDSAADETPDVSVIVVPYSVTKPGFIIGNDKVLHGETYTFSYTDTANYTYSDLTVKVGGTAVETLVPDENGVYTIAGVTGAIEITATQTPNSYDVTKPENVEGPDKATYGGDYIFTVTPKDDMAIDTVKVTLADGTEIPYTLNENGEYVIEGTNITGAFTITVTEKAMMTTITFTGIEETEIEGGKLTMTAEIGKDFTFKLIKEDGYDYTVKVGETVLTEDAETPGVYIVPAEKVVKGGVQVDITKEDNTKPVVDVAEYINLDGKTMFLVTAKWRDKVLAYGEEDTMFWSDKYTVTGEEEAGAYCWLVVSTAEMNTIDQVKAAAEAAIVEAAEGATATAVKYNYDINGTTKVDVNDAQLAYDMYNASYMEFSDNLPMLKFLEADMENDGKLDTKDVAAIINYIVSGANA